MKNVYLASFQSKITTRRRSTILVQRHCTNFDCLYNMRARFALFSFSLQVSVFLATAAQPVFAQSLPPQKKSPPGRLPTLLENTSPGQPIPPQPQPPAPLPGGEVTPSSTDGVLPQLNRYILGPGDVVTVVAQRPPGAYILGQGDVVAASVQRFPDLGFQAAINPEGNIIVPLLGTLPLQGLTLKQAQERIRSGLNRYVVNPDVTLSLVGLRPEYSFQAQINTEGNIFVPQVGTLSLQGLTLEEAQEKIRLSLNRVLVKPVVSVTLGTPRPVSVTISGEVTRPGIYPINPGTSRVSEALLTAGGSTMMADLRQIKVRRKLVDGSIVSQNVDLYTPLQNGTAQPNFRLQDGDAVIIPRRELATDDNYDRNLVARSTLAVPQIRIRILNYPGGGIVTVPLPNGSSFVDALGGVNLDSASLTNIALVRFDPERGRAITQKINGKKALSGDASQNVPLQDNDVIVVSRNFLGKITNLISTITRPFFDIESFLRFFEYLGGDR